MFDRGFKAWCERISLQERQAMELKPHDPLDPYDLAKKLEILVWTADQIPDFDSDWLTVLTKEDPDSWSAITLSENGRTLIVVNPTHSRLRISSDIAHELAHILIGHTPIRVDLTEDGLLLLSNFDKKQEEEAKWLCGCLLLPREALIHIKKQKFSDDLAREQYIVSQQMLSYRMQTSGVNEQFKRLNRKFRR